MEVFYKRFYFRPNKIWEIVREMLGSLGHDEAAPARGRRIFPVPCAHTRLDPAYQSSRRTCRFFMPLPPSSASPR